MTINSELKYLSTTIFGTRISQYGNKYQKFKKYERKSKSMLIVSKFQTGVVCFLMSSFPVKYVGKIV